VFFQDTNERPLDIKCWLKLRPGNEDDEPSSTIDYTKVPVVSETVEEIVFQSPHEWFYDKLCQKSSGGVFLPVQKISEHPLRLFMKTIPQIRDDEEECEKKLLDLEKFLRVQINNHQSQILLVDSDYRAYRDHFYKYNISG
jgi:hypothetical protein